MPINIPEQKSNCPKVISVKQLINYFPVVTGTMCSTSAKLWVTGCVTEQL